MFCKVIASDKGAPTFQELEECYKEISTLVQMTYGYVSFPDHSAKEIYYAMNRLKKGDNEEDYRTVMEYMVKNKDAIQTYLNSTAYGKKFESAIRDDFARVLGLKL